MAALSELIDPTRSRPVPAATEAAIRNADVALGVVLIASLLLLSRKGAGSS